MPLLPEKSRSKLTYSRFEDKGDSWFLNLPPFYADLLGHLDYALMTQSNTGWRQTETGKTRFAFFPALDLASKEFIEKFISAYRQHLVLGLNQHIQAFFTNELDFCLALDMNFKEGDAEGRTEIGQLEYQAKYQNCDDSCNRLSAFLAEAFLWLPRFGDRFSRCISYVPPERGDANYIPRVLAERTAQRLVGSNFIGDVEDALVHATLNFAKGQMKNSSVQVKAPFWIQNLRDHGVTLSAPVQGKAVYLIDDLYQSGSTLWAYAGHLKRLGASHVVGVACVKTRRDTDNQ